MRMFTRSFLSALACWVVVNSALAQHLPVFNQYINNPYIYNPSMAGSDTIGTISLAQKMQWIEMPDAPQTTLITLEAPLAKGKVGVGGVLFLDKAHITDRIGFGVSYAYHLDFTKSFKHKLSFGATLGLINQRVNVNAANPQNNSTDPLLISRAINGNKFDFSFGLTYKFRDFTFQAAIPQMSDNFRYLSTLPTSQSSTDAWWVKNYFLRASYLLKFGHLDDVRLEPGISIRGAAGLPLQLDFATKFDWKNTFWISAGYRHSNDATQMAGLNGSAGFFLIKNILSLNYHLESLFDGNKASAMGTSHEIMVSFRFGQMRNRLEAMERRISRDDDRPDLGGTISPTRQDSMYKQPKNNAPQEVVPNVAEGLTVKEMETIRNTVKDMIRNDVDLSEDMLLKKEKLKALGDDIDKAQTKLDSLEKAIRKRLGNNPSNDIQNSLDKIESVYFDQGSFKLTDYSRTKLNRAAQVINENYDLKLIKIVIYGNASSEGDRKLNKALSIQRANAVADYLKDSGLKGDILVTIGNGDEKPVTSTQNSEQERALNRRVDVLLDLSR